MIRSDPAVRCRRDPTRKWIVGASVAIPVIIGILLGVRIPGYDFSFLPPIYAAMNGMTALLLILAVVSIMAGKRQYHQACISICMLFSVIFLVLYIIYHVTSDPTPFGGKGFVRYVYYFVLISHVFLSAIIVPLVLFTYLRAWRGEWARHRSLARIAFPIWLYVSVTGVIVYFMISPFYP